MLDEEQTSHRIYGTDNTIGLFVSLYLIILAFFIVLTSVSSREAVRTVDATESLQTAFAGEDADKGDQLATNSDLLSPTEDPTLRQVDTVFQSTFEVQGRYGKQGGNIFVVDIPESYLFDPGAARLKASPTDIMAQLVEAANATEASRRSDILVLQQTPPEEETVQANRRRRLAFRRAGGLARVFESAGIERGGFAAGFANIGDGTIRFQFRTAPRFDPSLPLGMPGNEIVPTQSDDRGSGDE